jgi:hypothetical protein
MFIKNNIYKQVACRLIYSFVNTQVLFNFNLVYFFNSNCAWLPGKEKEMESKGSNEAISK